MNLFNFIIGSVFYELTNDDAEEDKPISKKKKRVNEFEEYYDEGFCIDREYEDESDENY